MSCNDIYIIYSKGCSDYQTRHTIGKALCAYAYRIIKINLTTGHRILYKENAKKYYECSSRILEEIATIKALKSLLYNSPNKFIKDPCIIETSQPNIYSIPASIRSDIYNNLNLAGNIEPLLLGFRDIKINWQHAYDKEVYLTRNLAQKTMKKPILASFFNKNNKLTHLNNSKNIITSEKDIWTRKWINMISKIWMNHLKKDSTNYSYPTHLIISPLELINDCNYICKIDYYKSSKKYRFTKTTKNESPSVKLYLKDMNGVTKRKITSPMLQKFFKLAISKNNKYINNNQLRIENLNQKLFN